MGLRSPTLTALLLLGFVYCEMQNTDAEKSEETATTTLPPPPNPESGWSRWLWWVLIVYMFMAQAEVCDEYFLESIKVVVDKYKIPEDVAGATLMALGCNGPELFVNFIALFITHTDLGVGTIVGSEIFNLLCIIGASVIASPQQPLVIDSVPFVRDVIFYALSIVLLTVTLVDSQVEPEQAMGLLACAGLFTVCVYYTETIAIKLGITEDDTCESEAPAGSQYSSSEEFLRELGQADAVEVTTTRHNRMIDSHVVVKELREMKVGSKKIYYGPNIYSALASHTSRKKNDRISSTAEHFKNAFYHPLRALHANEIATIRSEVQPIMRTYSMVHVPHAVTTPPTDLRNPLLLSGTADEATESLLSKPSVGNISFHDILCLRDHGSSFTSFDMDCRNEFGEVVTLTLKFVDTEAKLGMLGELSRHVRIETSGHGGLLGAWHDLLDNLQNPEITFQIKAFRAVKFPIVGALAFTMGFCDCRDFDKKDKWLLCFVASMCWLGVFSYLMVVAADGLNRDFGISQDILGITVCALGTSFPNFWASLTMAREGRSSIAIANALGSNVQNVFLALAIPWVFATCLPPMAALQIKARGVLSSVLAMGGTLLVLLILVAKGRFKLGKTDGWILLACYALYVIGACTL